MLTPGVIDVYQTVKSMSGTLGARSASWRARRIDDDVETDLDDPKTLTPDEIPKTTPLINCRQFNSKPKF